MNLNAPKTIHLIQTVISHVFFGKIVVVSGLYIHIPLQWLQPKVARFICKMNMGDTISYFSGFFFYCSEIAYGNKNLINFISLVIGGVTGIFNLYLQFESIIF
ncbi:hypothetical protein D3C87_1085450 [compost metagenome]